MDKLMTCTALWPALILAAAAAACSSEATPEEPPAFTELDRSRVTEQPVDGAPADHKLRATRLDDAGHRRIEHYDGTSWATFLTPADGVVPINMQAVYRDGQTLVCTQAIAQTDELSGLAVLCAVRRAQAPAFELRGTIDGEPNAWLNDVCVGEGGGEFTLLVSSARTPYPELGGLAELDRAPCGALAWTGSAWVATPTAVCACDQLDAKPCVDPCYVGTGRWQGGRCDLDGLAFRCDDGDPATADYCSGVADNLCAHELGAELLPP